MKILNFMKKNNVEENEEKVEMIKPKWNLKKKALLGAGVVAAIVGGVLLSRNKGKNEEADFDEDDSEAENESNSESDTVITNNSDI